LGPPPSCHPPFFWSPQKYAPCNHPSDLCRGRHIKRDGFPLPHTVGGRWQNIQASSSTLCLQFTLVQCLAFSFVSLSPLGFFRLLQSPSLTTTPSIFSGKNKEVNYSLFVLLYLPKGLVSGHNAGVKRWVLQATRLYKKKGFFCFWV